jgi:hypothetical protein
MRIGMFLSLALIGAGCSSADTLPSGGPYGGAAGDAGLTGATDAGGSVVFNPGDTGVTGSSSASGVVIVGSSSGSGATTTSSSGAASTATSGFGSTVATSSASATSSSAAAPTWTYLYDTYLSDASATVGDCDGSCHYHGECSSAPACFTWIGTGKYGALSNGGGLFTWDQGYMPKNGPTSEPEAETDFAAWIAAGSPDN